MLGRMPVNHRPGNFGSASPPLKWGTPFVPPVPGLGKPAFLFQDRRWYAGLYQRMGGGQTRRAGADHDSTVKNRSWPV
ncbi:hypothetical protein IQ26_04410 [Mesorhizobium tianshanense]|uniref:Uncharacterized protein n=1 Tax=Mesorhizobium tianshanense TaxID=39844 RepID=A0A562NHG4_9HYPH|nr:hypothetical protein IQ26_04410 [Mesorhizobium tianshanense]